MTIQQQLQELVKQANEPRYVTNPSGFKFSTYDPKNAEINGIVVTAYRAVQDRQNTHRARADRILWAADGKKVSKASLFQLLGI